MRDQSPALAGPRIRSTGLIIGWAAVGVLAALLLSAPRARADETPAAPTPTADDALSPLVAQELQDLGVKPKAAVLPSDQAFDLTTAIKAGDYTSARKLTEEVLSHSKVQYWRFYPFSDFIESIARSGKDVALLEHLKSWVQSEPKSATAYLIRATYYWRAAWAARSEERIEYVPPSQQRLFAEDIRLGISDVEKSIALNPRDPWAYYLLVELNSGNGNSAAAEAAFLTGVKAYPNYYALYRRHLFSLTRPLRREREEG